MFSHHVVCDSLMFAFRREPYLEAMAALTNISVQCKAARLVSPMFIDAYAFSSCSKFHHSKESVGVHFMIILFARFDNSKSIMRATWQDRAQPQSYQQDAAR
jgi:hypothetical protein